MINPDSVDVIRESIRPNTLRAPSPFEYFGMKKTHVARENSKTIVIYILIITVLILIGLLSFAGYLLFVSKSSVSVVDKIKLGGNSKLEQRFWYEDAFNDLEKSIEFKPNEGQAKNIIIFVGDGMGL